MSKQCSFISDNTPESEPNTLIIAQRDDCDIEIALVRRNPTERGVSVRASGSRSKNYALIIRLFSQIIDLMNDEDVEHTLYAKYCHYDAGYPSDKKTCKRELEREGIYKVKAVHMGGSSTDIELEGFTHTFNSVNFDFFRKEDDELVPHDIYRDEVYNPFLRYRRKNNGATVR